MVLSQSLGYLCCDSVEGEEALRDHTKNGSGGDIYVVALHTYFVHKQGRENDRRFHDALFWAIEKQLEKGGSLDRRKLPFGLVTKPVRWSSNT